MNKEKYLACLRAQLNGLPQADIEKFVDYYSEMIDDKMEEGLSEYEAVSSLESAQEAAARIMADEALQKPQAVNAASAGKRRMRAWEIVLIILGSPIWVSLLAAALSVYAALWIVIAALYISDFAVLAAGVYLSVFSFFKIGGGFMLLLGTAFVMLGFSVLMFFFLNKISVGFARLTGLIFRSIFGGRKK